jgi:phosphoserine phosphatase RsbU/P
VKSNQIEDLLKVLEISRNLVLHQDLQLLIGQIEQAAVKVLDCERATVFLFDKNTDELFSMLKDRPENIRIPSDCGIVGSCFQERKIFNVPDVYNNSRFSKIIDNQTGFITRAILAAPLYGDQQHLLGVLEAINKNNDEFEAWDEYLLEVLSAQCGMAINRHLLTEEFIESKRLQQELAIAREIQKSLLPVSAPEIVGYDIAGWNQSAEETGGDFFDFHTLSNTDLFTILADVSGHGVGPALLAAEFSALQRAVLSLEADYLLWLLHLNRMLCQNLPSDRFITAFASYLNAQSHQLTFLSAGHGPVFILRHNEKQIETLPVMSLPLGIIAEAQYDDWHTISLGPGDLLAVFTDGFFEWENSLGIGYGADRISQSLLHHADLPAAQIIQNLHQEVLNFVNGSRQKDDLTAIVIKRLN